MSDIADPTDPANPPMIGPNISALTNIIMSPKFRYPFVAGMGICTKNVATATSAAIIPACATIIVILFLVRFDCVFVFLL